MALTAPRLPPFPSKTTVRGLDNDLRYNVPIPTPAPLGKYALRKRQVEAESSLTSVCGYIDGNVSYPINCENAYCGYHYGFTIVGCCATYRTTSTSQVVLDSCNYHLACIGGDDYDGYCDESCRSNDMVLKCTEGSTTWCNTLHYLDYVFSGFMCGTSLADYTVYLETTVPGVTSYPEWVTTVYEPGDFASNLPGPTTVTNVPPRVPQSSNELGSHVGEIAAAVVGTSFGLVMITALVMFLCLRKRPRTHGTVRLNTNQVQDQPLMGNYSKQPGQEELYREEDGPSRG